MKAPLVLIVCVLAARVNSHEPSFAEITSSCADSVRTDEGRRLVFMLSQPFIDFFKTVMCLFRPGDVVHHGDTPLEHPLRDLIIKTAMEDRDDDDDSKAEESSSKTDLIASCVQEANAAIAQDLDEALMKLANCLERFGATLSDGVSPGASSVADH